MDEQLRLLKDFFSSREFALVNDLRVTPFFAGDRLVAVLLVVNSQTQPPAASADEIEAASPAIAAKIDSARAILGNGAAPTRDDALRSRLSTIFGEAESAGYHITVARIDLNRIAGEL
ncbi:MAG TPA: hypothetical protein VMW69_15835, partial [Spirochaetia bacterium]|nr:hypothetical protein [Spirochaetia bacterium]